VTVLIPIINAMRRLRFVVDTLASVKGHTSIATIG
jgi:hypothetical protein